VTSVLAVANQKGGVAKTTSVAALADALVQLGRAVLVVDLDPQACLTYSLGVDGEALERTVHDVLVDRFPAADAVVTVDGIDLLPANIDLAGAEVVLMARAGREHALRKALAPLRDRYDVVLIDCPPSLGVLTINGLTAADEVLVPLQCETLSLRGVGRLLETIEDIREYTNAGLRIRGVIATLYDGRTNLAQQVIDEVEQRYQIPVLQPPVPKSIRAAEAPAAGRSVVSSAPASKPAEAYRQLALVLEKDR
jgi:chromosome partitioning protein